MFLAIGLVVVGIWALAYAVSWWIDVDYRLWRYIEAGVGIILLTLGVLSLVIKK